MENKYIAELAYIVEGVGQRKPGIRLGQELFNRCYESHLLREGTDKLRSTNVDCFYDDSKVQPFMKALTEYYENC